MSSKRVCSCGKPLHWERQNVVGADRLAIVWFHEDRSPECDPTPHPMEGLLPDYIEGEVYWPVVGYNHKMEWLDYLTGDETTVTEYASKWVCILWNSQRTQIIGFRLNGFLTWIYKYIHENQDMDNGKRQKLLEFLKRQAGQWLRKAPDPTEPPPNAD